MHLVSWNVAGWARTLSFICQHHGSLEAWLARHQIDILCLQEVKTTVSKLSDDGKAHGVNTPGYDSFWAPCVQAKTKGFNGVATFARAGLTVTALTDVFTDVALDEEGRCLLTDHGAFVLFNVYVPNCGRQDPARMRYKMHFLAALSRKMRDVRSSGRSVVLVGDLNLTHRPTDLCPLWRSVDVGELLAGGASGGLPDPLFTRLAVEFPRLRELLGQKRVKALTVNSAKGAVVKYKVYAPNLQGALVSLGQTHESALEAETSVSLERAEQLDELTHEIRVVRSADELEFGVLKECLAKLLNWPLSPIDEAALLADGIPQGETVSPTQKWLADLLHDGFVDTFAVAHPAAQQRFTCWMQYKNKRYENEGARIDYVIVDAAFHAAHSLKAGPPLFGANATVPNPNAPAAALHGCTAFGRWKPAPFDGSGISEGTQQDYDAQFYVPHTGFIYTPPQFSDHISVTHVFCDLPGEPLSLSTDRATRKAQPHTQQRSINSFFKRPCVPTADIPATATPAVIPPPEKSLATKRSCMASPPMPAKRTKLLSAAAAKAAAAQPSLRAFCTTIAPPPTKSDSQNLK